MNKYYLFVICCDTEIGVVRHTVECPTLRDALSMLEDAANTFYGDPDISYHVEEHLVEYPN